jgi:hypothetical protein
LKQAGVIAGLFVLSACAGSSTAQETLPRVEPTRDSACVRAELPTTQAGPERLLVRPDRVEAGGRFRVSYPRMQHWSLNLLLEARPPCPGYRLHHDGLRLAWQRLEPKGRVAVASGQIRPRRRFDALVPPTAAPGTYRVCGQLRHGPCGTLTVVG